MRISLCMIVKDEELHLDRCLKSAQSVVDEMIIVDTGSTDQTVAIANQYGAKVLHHKWNQDFSAARNIGIDVASGDYILILDADEELPEGASIQIHKAIESQADGYVVQIDSLHDHSITSGFVLRIFKRKKEYRFSYPIHEQVLDSIVAHGGRTQYTDIKFLHYGYDRAEIERKDKTTRNTVILESIIQQKHPYFMYQLACEYTKSERHEEAFALYGESYTHTNSSLPFYSELIASYMISGIHMKKYDVVHRLFTTHNEKYFDYTDLYVIDGNAYLQENKYPLAIERFRAAIGRKPGSHYKTTTGIDSFIPLIDMGKTYEKMGENQTAIQLYQQAFALHPESHSFLLLVDILADQPIQLDRLIHETTKIINLIDPHNLTIVLERLALKGKKSSFNHLIKLYNQPILDKLFFALWNADFQAITEIIQGPKFLRHEFIELLQKNITHFQSTHHLSIKEIEVPIALKWDTPTRLLERVKETDYLETVHLIYRYLGLEDTLPHYISCYQNQITDTESLYRIGEALRDSGDFESAEYMYRLSYQMQPTPLNIFRLVEIAITQKDYKLTQELVNEGIHLYPESFSMIQLYKLLKKEE